MGGSDRRDVIASAALTVLIDQGSRGLTHRAVDAAAGLPPGSVNYYFDSRDKLLGAAMDEMFRQDEEATTEITSRHAHLFTGNDIEAAARGIARVINAYSSPAAGPRLRARQELLLEAQRRPAFQDRFRQQRRAFVLASAQFLGDLGATEPELDADALVVLAEGMLLRQVLVGESPLSLADLTHIVHHWLTAVVRPAELRVGDHE